MGSGIGYKSRKGQSYLECFEACLKIDILNRDSADYSRIEIFFDEWFRTNDRGPKF
jgi:hypothetical protein